MRITAIPELEPCESLYLSAHAHDVAFSCSARLLSETARGLRVLVVTLFGSGDEEAAAAAARLGARSLVLGVPEAARRSGRYASFASAAFGRDPEDDAWLAELVSRLEEVGRRTRAQHVYAPLGVGGHIDGRLAHEAALRAFESGDGRNVFLYEERPAAFVVGSVRVRLGQLGVRLPPAVDIGDRAGLARYLYALHRASYLRGELEGLVERFRCTGLATRRWLDARAWRPQKALGPRLQPVLHEGEGLARQAVVRACGSLLSRLLGSEGHWTALSTQYGRRIGGSPAAERYWLLLPPRDERGAEPLGRRNT